MNTPAPTQAQEIGTVSPLNEVDALRFEAEEMDQQVRNLEFSPELLKKYKRAIARARRLKKEGWL